MQKIVSIISSLGLLFNFISLPHVPPQHIICVDAGHGADDPGAMNGELTEADVNIDIAKRLQSLLDQNNYHVVMTRTDNSKNLTNSQRAAICNQAKAEVLVAIHLNSNIDPTLDYTQALYGANKKDKAFANFIHQKLVRELHITGPGDDGVTDFHDNLLLKAQMPATLQETIFISDTDEYDQLIDGSGQRQQQIAQALYDGINGWFTKKAIISTPN